MTTYPRLTGALALAASLSIAGCAGSVAAPSATTADAPATAAAAVTGAWRLQSLTRPDSTTVTVDRPELFTIEFLDGAPTRLTARVDCNRAVGPYTTGNGMLTIGAVAMTRAYCGATAAFGDEYMRLLDGEHAVTVTSGTLVLSSPRGTLRFSN